MLLCFAGTSIGKRYARTDEIGVPYALTVDYDTLTDKCVTLRERDTTSQVREPHLFSTHSAGDSHQHSHVEGQLFKQWLFYVQQGYQQCASGRPPSLSISPRAASVCIEQCVCDKRAVSLT